MQARIYRPAKSAMTSGMGNTRAWVLEFAPETPKRIDPLMGWTGSADMNSQVRLSFESKEAAIDYARRHGLAYVIDEPKPRKANARPQGYSGNFAHNRRTSWTH